MSWEGLSANHAAIEALKSRLSVAAAEVVTKGALMLQTQQRQNATHRPGPEVRTGALIRGILTKPTVQTSPYRWESGTYATVIYSRIQELGGHIYPRRAPMLVWTDGPRPNSPDEWRAAQRAGLVHRTRHVHIPARPYFIPALAQVAPRYSELSAAAFAAAIMAT